VGAFSCQSYGLVAASRHSLMVSAAISSIGLIFMIIGFFWYLA
jgi:hypothetical protein